MEQQEIGRLSLRDDADISSADMAAPNAPPPIKFCHVCGDKALG